MQANSLDYRNLMRLDSKSDMEMAGCEQLLTSWLGPLDLGPRVCLRMSRGQNNYVRPRDLEFRSGFGINACAYADKISIIEARVLAVGFLRCLWCFAADMWFARIGCRKVQI